MRSKKRNKQKITTKKSKGVYTILQEAKKANWNKDRSVKTADQFADHILQDLPDSALYSTEITLY